MLFVFGRARIVPIAVLAANPSVWTLNNDFALLVFGYLAGAFGGFLLSVTQFGVFCVPLSMYGPFVAAR